MFRPNIDNKLPPFQHRLRHPMVRKLLMAFTAAVVFFATYKGMLWLAHTLFPTD